MKAFKSTAGKAATATSEGARAVVSDVLNRRGKSVDVPHALFQNWLVKNFNLLPESETVMLMWAAWRECYETFQVAKLSEQLGVVIIVDELENK